MVLAVPTPTTRAAGTRLTGGIWQSDVTDTATFLLNLPDFVGTQGVLQSVATSTWVAITLDTEQLDNYGGHSTSSNTSRYTAVVAGWYTACGIAAFTNNGTGVRASRLQVNGSPISGGAAFTAASASNSLGCATPTRDIYLNVNDYVEVAGWQNSGGALNTTVNTDFSSALWVRWSHV